MSAIHVGSIVEKAAVEAMASAVVDIFEAAEKTKMDQSTVVAALEMIGRSATVNGATISGCNITSGESFSE